MKLLLPALALMLLAPPAAAAAGIGRLFYTPEQRVTLDTARSKRTRTTLETEAAEAPPPPAPAPEVVTYGGIVQRSDGKSTIWLNNRPLSGKQPADAPSVRRVRPDGTVTLHAPQSGRNVDLRVGQRAELLSGTVEEGYARRPRAKSEPDPAARPVGEAGSAGPAAPERSNEERAREERQQELEASVRALQEAAAAKSAAPPATPPVQPAR